MSKTKTEPESNTDIVVIGGGPAGSSVAKRLAEFGHEVVLLEKAVFPRPHVGICLSDATESLLDHLGMGRAMTSAGSLRRRTTLVKWGTDQPVRAEQPGVHVDRGVFDQLLLENARSSGVLSIQPARVSSCHRCTGGWRVCVEASHRSFKIYSRFLVDASGRAKAVTGKQVRYAPPLFAAHATWRLHRRPAHDGFMEAGKNAWLWIACLPGQHALVSVYADPKLAPRCGNRSLGPYYESLLREFSLMRCLDLDALVGEVRGCDASSRHAVKSVDDDLLRVGDANLSVDPMASQGVHLALSSGIQAAVVVNTMLRCPELADVAKHFYRDRQEERIRQFQQGTASEYAKIAAFSNEPFWQERAQDAGASSPPVHTDKLPELTTCQRIQVCPRARFLPTPVMKSDRISLEPALYHPKLDRPVAFLGGRCLFPLLRPFKGNQTVDALLATWEPQISSEEGMHIVHWLWMHQVFVPAPCC